MQINEKNTLYLIWTFTVPVNGDLSAIILTFSQQLKIVCWINQTTLLTSYCLTLFCWKDQCALFCSLTKDSVHQAVDFDGQSCQVHEFRNTPLTVGTPTVMLLTPGWCSSGANRSSDHKAKLQISSLHIRVGVIGYRSCCAQWEGWHIQVNNAVISLSWYWWRV